MKRIDAVFVLSLLLSVNLTRGAETYDVVVYGGTPGGIASAISAAREGVSVILLEQTSHVGGLSTSGLNRDEGNHMIRWTLGGFSERFTREAARRSGTDPDTERARVWVSRIAEALFLELLAEQDIPIRYEQLIDGVAMDGPEITVRFPVSGSTRRIGSTNYVFQSAN